MKFLPFLCSLILIVSCGEDSSKKQEQKQAPAAGASLINLEEGGSIALSWVSPPKAGEEMTLRAKLSRGNHEGVFSLAAFGANSSCGCSLKKSNQEIIDLGNDTVEVKGFKFHKGGVWRIQLKFQVGSMEIVHNEKVEVAPAS